ncbi:MAG TPA: hypothetical protein VFD37_07035 [Solirubrobacterales bacterium]|nr:hypothetical protein [Solirubrobacterales bacterium]
MLKRALILGALVALLAAGTASALRIQLGNLVMEIDGDFAPKALPANRDAPIMAQGSARIATADGSLPPTLKRMVLEFDRHGHVQTRGIPPCSFRRLNDTVTKDARRACGRAIVGQGMGRAVVKFPDQAPIPATAPLTLFSGPRVGGDPTIFAHAYMTVPAPTTYVVPIRIRDIRKGRYGYRTVINFPEIAGGHGIPLAGKIRVGKKWKFKGRNLSYLNASCVGGRLQARGFFSFDDRSELQGTLFNRCRVRR